MVVAHGLLLAGLPGVPGLPGLDAGPGAADAHALTVRQIVQPAVAAPLPVLDRALLPAQAAMAEPALVPAPSGARPATVVPPAGRRAGPAEPTIAGPARSEAMQALQAAEAVEAIETVESVEEAVPLSAPMTDPEPVRASRAATVPVASEQIVVAAVTAPASDSALLQAAAGTDVRPPTYATRRPAAAQLSYELRRGMVSGDGALSWRPDAATYELRIEGSVLGIQVLAQTSQGGFDAAGLAPQRFVDSRRGRSARAANFQRDKRLITYSGSAQEYPLLPGAQDRLSWMLQLAAIVEADPGRYQAGERVVMQVSGSRGDADIWTLAVVGREAVDVVGARIERALALRREPRKPYDTRVEVWLDPARQHLPVRLKLSSAAGNDGLELLLKP